jgi:7-cyano-7-deazaguanine synthase
VPPRPPAVVLLSGGLDSAVTLACALRDGHEAHALSIDYGQRHRSELSAAVAVASQLHAASHKVVRMDFRAIGGSALTADIGVPKDRDVQDARAGPGEVPVTYVPARNLAFLAIASGYAEVLGAAALYVGVNAVDYSGYPDCRPEFIESFSRTANLATRAGAEEAARGRVALRVVAPIIAMTKGEIIRLGVELGVDFALTQSCYDPVDMFAKDGMPGTLACAHCDACQIRRQGFASAGVKDPTRYA